MADAIKFTYTREAPEELGPFPFYAVLQYRAHKVLGIWFVTYWGNTPHLRPFLKLDRLSAVVYQNAQKRFSAQGWREK